MATEEPSIEAVLNARETLSVMKTGDSQADAYISMAVRRLSAILQNEARKVREAAQAARPSRPGRH